MEIYTIKADISETISKWNQHLHKLWIFILLKQFLRHWRRTYRIKEKLMTGKFAFVNQHFEWVKILFTSLAALQMNSICILNSKIWDSLFDILQETALVLSNDLEHR